MFQRDRTNQRVEDVTTPQIDRSQLQRTISTAAQLSGSFARDAVSSTSYFAYRFLKGFLGQPAKNLEEPKQSDEDKLKKLSDVGAKKVIASEDIVDPSQDPEN